MDPDTRARARDGGGAVSAGEIRAELAKILQSQRFARAPTLARLLKYLVEQTIETGGTQLKEYAVGVDVFGRGPLFDPTSDTIVRVHARRLRSRLREYYATEGGPDPVRIEVPRGGYLVQCRPSPAQADAAPSNDALASIVVLPFANLTGDTSIEYFADGLTDEITSALASLTDLQVVARTSAFQFKARGEDVRTIGRVLGVRTALEGSVRREGETIRVTATLIDARDGFQQWSQTYTRDMTGAFTIQDDVARAIATALWSRLGRATAAAPRSTQADRADAYDCYLRGKYFCNRGTPGDVARGIAYLEQAIALDPRYAAPWAALADAHVFLATLQAEAPGPLLARARSAAETALEIQDLAEGHAVIGMVLGIGDWDWNGAEREFCRALDLMPSCAQARGAYAVGCLIPSRRHDEALAQLHQAVRLDPLSAFMRAMLGQGLLLAGRADAAIEELDRALELDAGSVVANLGLAWAYLANGAHAAAVDVLSRLPPEARVLPNYAGHLGYAHARLGNRSEAEALLNELLQRYPGEWAPCVDVAVIHAGLGETERALPWLERGCRLRSFDIPFVRDDPRFADLVSDGRLEQLLQAYQRRPSDGA
jgi:serine/threonine-protein kinase